MSKSIIVQRLIEKEPELFNISQFLKVINFEWRIKILRLLRSTSYSYNDLMLQSGITPKTKDGSKFAYHLRRTKEVGVIVLDKKTKTYHLTFRGIKAVELLDSIEKITSLSISNPENALTKLNVDLNKNESWLKPLIKTEIRKAVREMIEVKHERQ